MTSMLGDTVTSALFFRPVTGQSLALTAHESSSCPFAASSQSGVPGPAQEAGVQRPLLPFFSWGVSRSPPATCFIWGSSEAAGKGVKLLGLRVGCVLGRGEWEGC